MRSSTNYLNAQRSVDFRFYPDGTYEIMLVDYEIGDLFSNPISVWLGGSSLTSGGVSLPFPEGWSLDDNGIQVDWENWASACDHFRLIPFWSDAE